MSHYFFADPVPPGITFSDSSIGFSPSASESSKSVVPEYDHGDGFMDSQFRAGGPILCDLPTYSVPAKPDGPLRDNHSKLLDKISEILRDFGIKFSYIGLRGSLSFVSSEANPIPTWRISVTGENSNGIWREAARAIYKMLGTYEIFEASVDILHQELERKADCFPVLETDAIFTKWTRVYSEILQTVKHDDWTSVGCYRYGRKNKPTENAPTVLVTVLDSIDRFRKFDNELDQIRNILAQNGVLDTRVEIVKDGPGRVKALGGGLRNIDVKDYVQPGVSFGIRGDGQAAGTFGGIVELRRPGEVEFEKYGLTSFSNIYDPNQQGCKWYRRPLTPDTMESMDPINVDQPSLRDLQETAAHSAATIQQWKSEPKYEQVSAAIERGDPIEEYDQWLFNHDQGLIDNLQKQHNTFSAFEHECKHHLGHVVAGSGVMRTNQCDSDVKGDYGSTLDWALIKIDPQRMGSNVISPDFFVPTSPSFSAIHLNHYIRKSNASSVFKLGRSTGLTEGQRLPLKTVRITRYLKEDGTYEILKTEEYSVCGSICAEGDSGSLMFSRSGGLIGMLFASQPGTGIAFFTPFEDVFDDIKKVTGAEQVRIPEAWDDE